jgi:hypothetical protein
VHDRKEGGERIQVRKSHQLLFKEFLDMDKYMLNDEKRADYMHGMEESVNRTRVCAQE